MDGAVEMRARKVVPYFWRFYLATGKPRVHIIDESAVVAAKYRLIVVGNEYLATRAFGESNKVSNVRWITATRASDRYPLHFQFTG